MALSLYDLGQGASTELSTRASADIVLSTNVSTEVSTRTAQSTTTSTGLSTEVSTRTAQSTTTSTGLSTEVSTRAAQSTTTSTGLSTEVSTRISSNTALSIALSTETSLRTSADTALQAGSGILASEIAVDDTADASRINLGNNVTNLQLLTDTVNNLGVMTAVKTAYTNNVYTIITYNRVSSVHGMTTKFMTSTLTGTGPDYATRTEVYYDTNGTTVLATKVYTILYNGTTGIVESETCA